MYWVIQNFYNASDILFSLPSSDSSPNCVFEALFCNKLVIVSDFDWVYERLDYEDCVQKVNHKNHEFIIICDFLNNFFDLKSLEKIKKSNTLCCCMSQKNSKISLFQTRSYLNYFDRVCINEVELISEVRDKKSYIDLIARKYLKNNNLKYLVITKGIEGSILIDSKLKIYSCPSFNSKPIDKVGGGDSMLAIISILLKKKINPPIALLIASLVASNVVNNIGNKYAASKTEIERSLEYIFK